MKYIDEEWTAAEEWLTIDGFSQMARFDGTPGLDGQDDDSLDPDDERSMPVYYCKRARARLASAAPDMARVLLRIEWQGNGDKCPTCGNYEHGVSLFGIAPGTHREKCALEGALRKAGVRP